MSSRKYLDLNYWNSKKSELLGYLENGCTYTQLGEIYGEERDFMVRVIYNLFNISIKNNSTDRVLPFTKKELEKKLIKELCTKDKVSKEFNVGKEKLDNIIKLFNIRIPLLNNNHTVLDSNFEDVKRLIKEGKSYLHISKIYGISGDVVRLFSRRYNLRDKKTNFSITKEELEQLLLVDKLSIKEISKIYNIGENVIRKWCKSLGLYEKYINKEYITTPNSLPMPLEYSYPLFISISIPGREFSLVYIPELNKFICSINLNKELRNNGIVPEYWKLRWIERLPSIMFTTDNWIDLVVNKFYSNKPEKTINYIRLKLRSNPNYVCDFFMLSDDLVDLYYQHRSNIGREFYNYDFSIVPKFIKYRETKFTINILEINPETGNPIGLWNTDYNHFIEAEYDNTILGRIRTNRYLEQNVKTTLDSLVEKVNKIYGQDKFDFSEAIFTSHQDKVYKIKCKSCGNYFDAYPGNILHRSLVCHHCQGSESIGESLVGKWLDNNKIDYKTRIRVDGIESRNSNYVIIDFILYFRDIIIWIEYNGDQHYKEIPFFHKSMNDFNNQIKRDNNVRSYCLENNIQLLEIPYTYNTYEKVKDLLDRVILGGEDINTIVDYQSLYKM